MQIGLRQFSADTVQWFKSACKQGTHARAELTRNLCRREAWLDYRGQPSLAAARKVLPRLAAELDVALPPPRAYTRTVRRRPAADYPDKTLSCTLAELGEVQLVAVETADRHCFAAMIESHHPAGWRPAPGGLLRYWIVSSRHGRLGGLSFGAGGWQLRPRDAAIGWRCDARRAHIDKVLINRRFLILPSVRVGKLASQVLRLACERVAGDWALRYGVRPLLVYSFTGPGYTGLSYRAAGWRCCAERSSGRRSGVRRAVWLKPLAAGWRAGLCAEPAPVLGCYGPLYCEGAWAEREYGRSSYPDGRVRRRLAAMGKAWLERPGEPLPVIFPGQAEQKAAYRLLSNARVRMAHILEPHYEATVERCRREPLILALQDTTTLNYGGLSSTTGLDALGGGGKGTRGLLAHCGVAVNGVGRPLGLYTLDADFRRAEGKDSGRWVAGLRRGQALSAACPESRVVNICDREGDFWELLEAARQSGAELLVRASRSARRRVLLSEGKSECLWSYMGRQPVLGHRRIRLAASGGVRRRKARKVRLALRAAYVDLKPPVKVGGPPLRMLAVSAGEVRRPTAAVRRPKTVLSWLLLTTGGSADAAGAEEVVRFYELRWRIERFFHALKTGTRIEDRKLDRADDLGKCLAFDAITAFRVWDLALLAREKPADPAGKYVPADEIKVLQALAWKHGFCKSRDPPEMTMERYVVLTAGQAGFHPSKRQPLPGTQKLWEGLQILSAAVFGYQAMRVWEAQGTV